MLKIYIASSWKNDLYDVTKQSLEMLNHKIMDWRDPIAAGFKWSDCTDVPKEYFTGQFYRDVILNTDRAIKGFNYDFSLMKQADCCVLLLPCGRSAHLEAGWFIGQAKPLFIYITKFEEPELMYKFGTICLDFVDLTFALYNYEHKTKLERAI